MIWSRRNRKSLDGLDEGRVADDPSTPSTTRRLSSACMLSWCAFAMAASLRRARRSIWSFIW
jgi:hypothetical protein